MRISDWSSDVCSSDLRRVDVHAHLAEMRAEGRLRIAFVEVAIVHAVLRPQAFPPRQRPQRLRLVAQAHQAIFEQRLVRREAGRFRQLGAQGPGGGLDARSEEHTSELQSLMPNT